MFGRVRGIDYPVHVGYLDDAGREVPPPTSPSSGRLAPHETTAN
jgi:hypothetical protein